jgi:methylthioribose-1-phosphate isomerase
VVLDSAIAYAISNVDFVLTGAEAVVENGGIINKVLNFYYLLFLNIRKLS